jgi:hypothetical protein
MYPVYLFLLLGGTFTLLAGTVVVYAGLRRAPVAREDENGFHVIEDPSRSIATSASADVAQITS